MNIIASSLILFLKMVRPLLGPAVCLYSPSCSQFAYEQLQKKSLFPACVAIAKQLLRCNSFTR